MFSHLCCMFCVRFDQKRAVLYPVAVSIRNCDVLSNAHATDITLFLGQLFDGLKCPSVRMCIHSYVCTYIRPSIKSFFDFNEIWRVGRGVSDARQYAVYPSKFKGHEPFNVGNPATFKSYLLHHLQWELATDH